MKIWKIQWVLRVIFWLTLVDASPIYPLPPHSGILKDSYIAYYEPASYDTSILRDHKNRVSRDTSEKSNSKPLIFRLNALDRQWTMKLFPDTNLFAQDAVFEGTNGPIPFDTSHSYFGTIDEDDDAIVEGIVTKDGLFDGVVLTSFEEYYFEPASRYMTKQTNSRKKKDVSLPYHTIAYRASDVIKPPQPRSCPSHSLHRGNITSLFQKSKNESFQPFFEQLQDHKIRNYGGYYLRDINRRHFSNREMSNFNFRDKLPRHLHKRATVDPKKTTCMLYLQADHQFFAKYGTEEACIEVMTRHVQRVNSIYKNTDFNQDGRPDNISFMIKRVKVHTDISVKKNNYRFPGNYGVEKFLELFSEEDYDAFCLAYMFTYRDFEMGTLGLAWTGDLKNAGGVCEKNGHYRGSMKSLNTGIVTLLNYGKHVPPAVSHVTLAHEIGHNFGSPHDPEQCTPGGEDGNFIMFARATSGDKRNNNKFSPCSLSAINPVLNSKARSQNGCFIPPQASLCGNGVVEEGEECDVGWEDDDSCCHPQRLYPPEDEKPCTLKASAICSPSQGPCCTTDCKLKFSDKCRDDNGCRDTSFCDGKSPYCPPSVNKPNKTICNRDLVCFMGECTGSICLAYGLESCQCIPGPNDPPTKACELCCRLPGSNKPCLSSFDWNSPPYDIPDMYSKPGTPCNDYNGYCDVLQKCREVDPSGPLATLRKLLLSDESLASFKLWVIEHWYAVVLLIIGTISLLVASILFLGKRSNPKLKLVTIIHSSTTETVRLPPENAEGVTIHPPAIRTKLPLKQKVREKRRRTRPKDTATSKSTAMTTMVKKRSKQASEKKKKKKKKRVAPIFVEEINRKPGVNQTAGIDNEVTRKVNSKDDSKKRKKHKKEVIDYSTAQTEDDSEILTNDNSDAKSKVQSWLSTSQCRENSKPTPVVNSNNPRTSGVRIRPGNRRPANSSANSKSNERVKLQIVYKSPFKFSVKLRKVDKNVQPNRNVRNNNSSSHQRAAVLVRSKKSTVTREQLNNSSGIINNDLPIESSNIANSDLYTVPSDLEVLLSESEFLFSDS